MRCRYVSLITNKRCRRTIKRGMYCYEHKRSRGRPSRRDKIKEADALFSQLIRKRGKCAVCGATKNLHCAHIISRVNKNLRWNEDNALCMCRAHHLYWFHKSPLEFSEWFQKNYPIQHAFLLRERWQVEHHLGESIEFTIERLKKRLEEVC